MRKDRQPGNGVIRELDFSLRNRYRELPKEKVQDNWKSQNSNFFELVYLVVMQVPCGSVTSYSAVAKFLNNPRGSRAVGWAMRQCPYSSVPCHRVIKADGSVGGYGGEGVLKKVSLLKKEGVEVRRGKIDLSRYLFTNFRLGDFC